MSADSADPLVVPVQTKRLQASTLSEIIRVLLDTDYLIQVEEDVLYICHSNKEKMNRIVNDLTSALVFGHAKLMGCNYVHFHSYGRVSVAGGLAYIRNAVAEHLNQVKTKQFDVKL
jgi:hypothetical protein